MVYIFPLEVQNNLIYLRDIKYEDLPHLLKWYNNTTDFKYATGIDSHVTIEYITAVYSKAAASSTDFFSGIYMKKDCKMVGVLKGRLHKGSGNTIWITLLLIDPDYQQMGIGTRAVEMLLEYFSQKIGVRNAYLAVSEENDAGKSFWEKRGFLKFKKTRGHFKIRDRECEVIVMHRYLCSVF